MEILYTPSDAHAWCTEQREHKCTIGMVPTMGALHRGHLSLVERAVRENDLCVVSIFVNPLQFNAQDDFDAYPRDIENDCKLLAETGCDMAFTGTLQQFFPEHQLESDIPMLAPGDWAQGLEGEHRPGHFEGVRTIVDRLFDTAVPTRAYFGEKDFQQTLVIKDLALSKGYPEIVICPTEREPNGLAMSSRNQRLTKAQREQASAIYRALQAAKSAWATGERTPYTLSRIMIESLAETPLRVEYATVRDPSDWLNEDPNQALRQGRALIAAHLGGVRLIDNLALN